MKKNVRNALAISGLALAIGASGLTLTASANTTTAKIEKHQSLTKIARVKKTETIKNDFHKRTFHGTVTEISADSLTITKGSKTFTVNTSSTTRILNNNWKTINFSDIKSGDKIKIQGTVSNTIITARTIRDISLK
jgi:hypothetical protein